MRIRNKLLLGGIILLFLPFLYRLVLIISWYLGSTIFDGWLDYIPTPHTVVEEEIEFVAIFFFPFFASILGIISFIKKKSRVLSVIIIFLGLL